jgi:ABC-type cobalt transport system substrate-binding protein
MSGLKGSVAEGRLSVFDSATIGQAEALLTELKKDWVPLSHPLYSSTPFHVQSMLLTVQSTSLTVQSILLSA